jgi:hypothetical protein
VTGPAFEAFLARIYTDRAARERFLADPEGEARRAGLSPREVAALASVDRAGLALAAESFALKRGARE